MSISYSGTVKRSAGLYSALTKQIKLINLKPVKKLEVQFDPFDTKSRVPRDFVYFLSSPKVISTNPNCILKTNVVCDRSEAFVKIQLIEGKNILLKAGNLTTLELLQLYNKYISSQVKQEVVQVVQTKSTKKGKK